MLVRSGPGLCTPNYRSTLVPFHIGSMFRFLQGSTQHGIRRLMVGFGSFMTCVLFQSVSAVFCQTASDYGYHTFGELARFIYCLLQEIKQGSSLPLVEQWDDYVLPNHSKFPPNADGEFLAGTRVLAALNKIGSFYLQREF